ncbi:hypothetical protein [Hyphomicrobium sp.]|uniref:hypothetical protein n=1 Tax=Hyphomicrobium sp. TaxID=82 RepID=UPI002E3739FE|nr:hypothetical protein [Hyphomicrobium sp.]HEX2840527.1 hypothetical protein [Hyphomicrobium sp.]
MGRTCHHVSPECPNNGASELTTLELGPVIEIEQSRKLSAEIDQDRLTHIGRAIAEEADERFLDLPVSAASWPRARGCRSELPLMARQSPEG